MKRLIRFLKALWKYILYGKRVSFKTYVQRLTACSRCPYLNIEKWTCDVCGCYVDKKNKMSTEKCPKGVW